MLGKYIQSSVLAKRVDPGWIWLIISIVIGSIFSTSTNSDDRIVNGSVQTSLKQETMGHYQLTKVNLQRALVVAKTSNNQVKTASILGSLGNLSISRGQLEQAEAYLKKAVNLISDTDALNEKASLLNNLGNVYALTHRYQLANSYFQQSVQLSRLADNPLLLARTLANQARLKIKTKNFESAILLGGELITLTQKLPTSQTKVYLLINIARTFTRISEQLSHRNKSITLSSYHLLTEAADIAKQQHDATAAAYALGYLGDLYAQASRHQEALQLTHQAIFQAQQAEVSSQQYLLYLWYWQAAGQYRRLDKPQAAIDFYRLAINILQKIRYQLVVTDQAPDQSFRDSTGAIYLQFVDLLLQQASKTSDSSQLSLLLKEARDTVEQLKAAELRNYFQDECVDILKAKTQKIETVSSSAKIIYPIILHDRLEILVSHAETGLRRYSVPVDPVRLIDEIRTFRRLLSKQTTYQYRHSARLLYNWLIRPFESDLAEQAIDTLVFVPDGPLRTIPMAALFDGTQHLIEKYAVVTTPGIELTDPRPLESHTIKATIAGLSESIAGFPALTSVQNELTNIHSLYGGNMLINDAFVKTRLKSALQNSNINVLHIATHGQFENKSENSFLLTYDGRLTLNQLSNYIGLFKFRETPLELLVLSACETAQGDDQAALGLSGIAIKSGARSALGTLWRVNDAATSELMTEFYQQLKLVGVSRAAALQKAQLKLQKNIRFRHPVYWSPFLLINSWL